MFQEPHLYCQIVSKQVVWMLSASEGVRHSANHNSLFHVTFSTVLHFYSNEMFSVKFHLLLHPELDRGSYNRIGKDDI